MAKCCPRRLAEPDHRFLDWARLSPEHGAYSDAQIAPHPLRQTRISKTAGSTYGHELVDGMAEKSRCKTNDATNPCPSDIIN